MTMANTFAAKLSVAFVAIAMALSMVAPAQAQTAEELQAQIDTLMATIASLQGQLGVTTPVATGNAYVFTRDLTIGSTGADVTALQTYLISAGFSIPAGATGYFGSQTQAAVAAWQTANGVMPAAGYFGPVSQAKYTALVAVSTPTTPDDEDEDEDEDESEDNELSGEASLGDVESSDGDDTEIEEGQEAAPVAEFEVEFDNGDAEISRIDLTFVRTSANPGEDAWETFEEISLWVDGDEVATMAADDEDEYLSDEETLRFGGLDIVAMEDEPVTIVVAVTAQGSIDDLPSTWEVDMTEIRYVDADDVTSTDDVTVDAVEFDVQEAGSDDELDIKSSSEDPDATTLQLEEDGKSDWYTVFAFDLDSDDSTNDAELNDITLEVDVTSDGSSALNSSRLLNDAKLVIDGEEFDVETITNSTSTATLLFEVDGDYVVEAGERVTAELQLEFKALEAALEGATVQASVDGADIEAEGADDITVGGASTGDEHTLRTSGIAVEAGSDSADATVVDGADNDYATFEIEVDVTAFEDPAYISQVGAVAFTYQIEDSSGVAVSSSTATSSTISSDADVDAGFYVVEEGETETFTLRVTYNPLAADEGDSYRLQILTIEFNDTAAAPTETWNAIPASDFETGFELIND